MPARIILAWFFRRNDKIMLIALKNILVAFFTPRHLFARNLPPFSPNIARYSLIFLLALLAFSLLWRWQLVKNKDIFAKKAARRFFGLAWTMGIIGLFLWVFRQIRAAYLSSPLFVLLWFVILLVWLGFWLNYRSRTVPARRRQLAQEAAKKAYLP